MSEFCKKHSLVTPEGLKNYLRNADKPITSKLAKRSALFEEKDIGKTPRELGWHYA